MTTPREIQNSLRRSTSYLRDRDRLEVRAMHLSRRVEALTQERDALLYRLQATTAENERLRQRVRTGAMQRQAALEVEERLTFHLTSR